MQDLRYNIIRISLKFMLQRPLSFSGLHRTSFYTNLILYKILELFFIYIYYTSVNLTDVTHLLTTNNIFRLATTLSLLLTLDALLLLLLLTLGTLVSLECSSLRAPMKRTHSLARTHSHTQSEVAKARVALPFQKTEKFRTALSMRISIKCCCCCCWGPFNHKVYIDRAFRCCYCCCFLLNFGAFISALTPRQKQIENVIRKSARSRIHIHIFNYRTINMLCQPAQNYRTWAEGQTVGGGAGEGGGQHFAWDLKQLTEGSFKPVACSTTKNQDKF